MYEIELKVQADHTPVRDRLQDRDAEHVGTVHQVDTYYDHPARSFPATDEALRIRHEKADNGQSVARLTYKGPLVESASKTRKEIETEVGDAEALDATLRALGFDPVPEVSKERKRFAIGEYTVTLDAVEDVGTFVEVESQGTEDEIETVREGARDLLRDLGLDPENHVRTSYLELVLDAAES